MNVQTRAARKIGSLAAAAAVLAASSVCSRGGSTGPREELRSVPGAAVLRIPASRYAEEFQEARLLIERQDFSGAERIYREILARDGRNADAYLGLGTVRLQQDDFHDAGDQYRRALELAPTKAQSYGALIGLGSVAYRQNDYAAAESFYNKALALEPDSADAHWGLGITLERLGKADAARDHFAAFLRIAPDSTLAPRARLKLQRGDSPR